METIAEEAKIEFPKPEPIDPSHYPRQKEPERDMSDKVEPYDGKNPLLPYGVSILDLSVAERKKYMWLVPKKMREHPMYNEDNYGARIKREDAEKKQKEEDDKKKKDQDKDDKIEMLLKYVADLGKQMNELTKQIQTKK